MDNPSTTSEVYEYFRALQVFCPGAHVAYETEGRTAARILRVDIPAANGAKVRVSKEADGWRAYAYHPDGSGPVEMHDHSNRSSLMEVTRDAVALLLALRWQAPLAPNEADAG